MAMLAENEVFSIHDADRQLFVYGRNGQYAKLVPEIIDRKLGSRTPSILRAYHLTQEGLEHLVLRCGSALRVLFLDGCTFVRDFSPLSELVNLEAICIEDCRSINSLWDLSWNTSLKILSIRHARKIIFNPIQLGTSSSLEEIRLWGNGFDSKHVLDSLSCFGGMKSLRRIDLNCIKLQNHNFEVLSSLPDLEEFHFDAGMLSTEEIAWICAKHPHLYGTSLRAYTTDDPSCMNDVRICGARKPGLDLLKDQARLDVYISQFNSLLEKYRSES